MKFQLHAVNALTLLFPLALLAQGNTNDEGFKTATVSDYITTMYKWEKPKPEEEKVEVENDTPLKSSEQKAAERQAAIDQLVKQRNMQDRRLAEEEIPEEEQGLDTVELREFQISELYSPLMRMSEIKNLDVIDPASGGVYLTEEYYTNCENNILNRWTIPIVGRSQEQRAKEEYRKKQYDAFLTEVSNTLEHLQSLDPEYAKQVAKEFNDTQYQYNINEKDDPRFDSPDAKF